MAHVDPAKFSVHPIAHDEITFQDMIAEQLRRAPWLALSAGAHAIAILLLWVLIPAETKEQPQHRAEVVDTSKELVQPVEPPKPIETQPEEIPDEIDLVDPEIVDNETDAPDVAEVPSETLSAFTSNQWNTSLGLEGGAAGNRDGGGRIGRRRSAPKAFLPPIEDALRWLARHQDDDGRWDCDQFMKHDAEGIVCDGAGNAVHDVGVTGLALLAFLGDGNTMRAGPYRENVKRGVLWLREQQQDNGLFGTATSHDFVYDHAIAAYAMCEAYGLSSYTLLKPVAQKAINYLESHRNPYGVWRYQPGEPQGDASVTGWCIMAYESGKHFGLEINDSALQLAALFLDQVTDATGRHGYTKAGESSSRKPGDHEARFPVDKGEAMTAVGLFCRYFMGQKPSEKPVMKAAADRILEKPPVWDEQAGTIDHYYWYYGTYALFQASGRHWQEWQRRLTPAVVRTQHTDKTAERRNLHGSWDPVGAWGEDGGRVYSTAILCLTLQAHYRYSLLLR